MAATVDINPEHTNARSAEAAARIANEVRHGASAGGPMITKVTSLLHAFRTPTGPARINNVIRDLQEQGLEVSSGWELPSGRPDIRRPGVLKVSLSQQATPSPVKPDSVPMIRMSVWSPNGQMSNECALPTFEPPSSDDVLWFNVDSHYSEPSAPLASSNGASQGVRRRQRGVKGNSGGLEAALTKPATDGTYEALEAQVRYVKGQLESWCPGLDEEMVRDILRADIQPKIDTYGDESDGVRGVSALAVIAREVRGAPHDSDGVSEELIFQLVEMIVGPGWIVTCWHPSRIFTGGEEPRNDAAILREPFMSHVRHRWSHSRDDTTSSARPGTSSELGMYLTRSLVDTYGASHRMMEGWVSSWEATFYRSLCSDEKMKRLKAAAIEISNMLSMVGEFRRRLTAFEHARLTTTDHSWFPGLADQYLTDPRRDSLNEPQESDQVSSLVTSLATVGEKFDQLTLDIRADMDLLMLQSAAVQQESTERLQKYLGKVTGLVLVPTLVAGLFGANTRLPGGGSWLGFEIMLALMVISGVIVYWIIHKLVENREGH